ncbi:MAG: serine/threonine-protein kinase [Myxococcota bacterium]
MDEQTDLDLAAARPGEDLEDDRVRSLVASRLLGRTEHATVGRFRIEKRLGAGAMGIVYSAYDPRLDRRIALKVLPQQANPDRHSHVLREARAAARIHHPHVMSVFDSGEHEGQVWIAMELVDGCTLRQWWQAETRSWREILRVFMQCAEALAEAHRLDVVHRDFKPNNVLVETRPGTEVQARVVDFGIAADLRDRGRGTLGGGGTPAYMAPEQRRAVSVDGRADQFSLSVALYEALHRELPFPTTSREELAEAVAAGEVRPFDARLPRWLRRIITRGLQPDPIDRFETMSAWIEQAQRGLGRRQRVFGLGALVVVGAASAMLAAGPTEFRETCDQAGSAALEVWSTERQQRVRAWFGDGDARPFEDGIDAWTERWRQARHDACTASEVRGHESARARALRDSCLDHRLTTLDGYLEELLEREPTAMLRAQATRSVRGLPALESCADAAALLREVDIEGDPERVRDIREHQQRVAYLQGRQQLLPLPEAETLTRAAVDRARTLEHPPLTASAMRLSAINLDAQGRYDEAAEMASQAYLMAIAGRADQAATDNALLAALVHARGTRDFPRSSQWLARADAWIQSQREPVLPRAYWHDYAGILAAERGEYEAAAGHHRDALALRRSSAQTEDTAYTSLSELARAERLLGHNETALAHLDEARTELERTLGPDHPDVARIFNNLGSIAQALGRLADARRYLERALELKRSRLGPDHPEIGSTLVNLSNVAWELDERDHAIELLTESIALRERAHGAEHPSLVIPLSNLALSLLQMKRYAQADRHYARALGIGENALGRLHPATVPALVGWAQTHYAEGRFADARPLLARARAIVTEHPIPPVEQAEIDYELARTLKALGEPASTVAPLARRAREHCEPSPSSAPCEDIDLLLASLEAD